MFAYRTFFFLHNHSGCTVIIFPLYPSLLPTACAETYYFYTLSKNFMNFLHQFSLVTRMTSLSVGNLNSNVQKTAVACLEHFSAMKSTIAKTNTMKIIVVSFIYILFNMYETKLNKIFIALKIEKYTTCENFW